MPPELLFDASQLDPTGLVASRDEIYKILPHRAEFMQLHGVTYLDGDRLEAVGYRDVTDDEFWVKGHIPGRPLLPGVLMIESAAQLASYVTMTSVFKHDCFLGLGGVDCVKFRGVVSPTCRMVLLTKLHKRQSRKLIWACQALVDGRLVFEGHIVGMQI